ncbi:NAD/NADP octopine/nopaline dehydrogenase family protein [Dickeya zeae]|uniref:NAD/NADP octopine/nopaline dehydrogenase family protein n=1 Tax=Dickeya zeae TaxID=204042 RepID=UPI000C9C5E87|nr:NAD/NADP octopine/nopaline dehydrogenase family protein [Dickeya zeae]AUQ24240.1 hypothetical protein C1O30_03760 [Dickeya zeae]UJR57350.1 hypothetical protein HJ580_03720 [Dickeya zeae]
MENVLIIGGGHVGSTLAVDMYARRHETFLEPHLIVIEPDNHPFYKGNDPLKFSMENILSGETYSAFFPKNNLHHFGYDLSELFRTSIAVILTVPDIPLLREKLLQYIEVSPLQPGTTVAFVRAGQGGQIPLIDKWRKSAKLCSMHLLLVEDSFYGTRCINNVIEYKRKKITRVAIPGDDRVSALSFGERVFSGYSIGLQEHRFELVRPLDLQFDPLGYIIHLAVAFDPQNLCRTGRGEQYLHYSDGVHEGNSDLIEALDRERVKLAGSFGARTRLFTDMLTEQYGIPQQKNFLAMIKSTRSIYRSLSEASIDKLKTGRIISEDYPGLLTMNWLTSVSGENYASTNQFVSAINEVLTSLNVNTDNLQRYQHYLDSLNLNKQSIIDLLD